MIVFNSSEYTELELPPVVIHTNELLRIECETQSGAKALYNDLIQLNFSKVIIGSNIPKRRLFSNPTVSQFLLKSKNLSLTQINDLCQRSNIDPELRVHLLTEGQKNAISLFYFAGQNKNFLIYTVGMYVSCLTVCYEIIANILAIGGSCIEVTYPPYSGDKYEKNLETSQEVKYSDKIRGFNLKVIKR